ncbi:MAG: GntP family permease [PS1 clade bacterium]|uniref:GntP family permease n=1 Tax=PS1 clade bacterium TaxID=2175152 RepID=A0A937HCL0_9PROT|nr:GntP family permease [PS1 clade bacterium]
MANIGLLAGLALLIFLALRGVNIFFASLLSGLVVALTNGLPVHEAFGEHYATGPLGTFSFAGRFFLLFIAGAIFGRIMGESKAATSIALALVERMGAHRALLITVLSCAALTYGGVVVFVVIFAMYPLGLSLLKEADIPKRLFCAALALGAATFTLTALPGTPSIQNVIPSVALGTDLFAAPLLGLIGGAIMFVLGMVYLERERLKAQAAGEGFEPGPRDKVENIVASPDMPDWRISLLPLVLVLSTILLPRLLQIMWLAPETGMLAQVITFAGQQPIFWPSLSLILGSLLAYALFPNLRGRALQVFGEGTNDAVMPLLNTAAVIGFGGIVVQTIGFQDFSSTMLNSGLPPKLSAFASISLVSAITGSASGGLQIFMATMAESYIAMGIPVEELHRIVAMASGGFDTLPHCGGVIAMLTITQLTHKQAYKDVGIITVVFPVIATLVVLAISTVI